MLPTMVLPAAAILLSLGSLPWSAWGLSSVSEVATYAGQAIFYYMPYLFAVGVAWGLSIKPEQGACSAGWDVHLRPNCHPNGRRACTTCNTNRNFAGDRCRCRAKPV